MSRESQGVGPVLAASMVAVILGAAVVTGSFPAKADPPPVKGDKAGPWRWSVVSVDLPVSDGVFPPGEGAHVADSQCLICHSAGMVLRQPPLTKEEWRAEIVKMRSAYGALLPVDQVDALSEYLQRINGR